MMNLPQAVTGTVDSGRHARTDEPCKKRCKSQVRTKKYAGDKKENKNVKEMKSISDGLVGRLHG